MTCNQKGSNRPSLGGSLDGRPDEAADAPTATDLAAVADRLDNVIAQGEPEQTKALLRILIAELRVNSKTDIQPTYPIAAPGVCATSEKVDARERRSTPPTGSRRYAGRSRRMGAPSMRVEARQRRIGRAASFPADTVRETLVRVPIYRDI